MYQPVCMLLAILAFCGWSIAVEIETPYEWKFIDYVWESEDQREDAVNKEVYNYTKIVPVDFQWLQDGRVLITIPRYHNNPASLSTISDENGPGGPLLRPYPSWDWHRQGNCSGMASVSRVIVDKCNRLWIVDSGKVGKKQRCPAQILAFDTRNDELLQRVEIPKRFSHSSRNSSRGRLEIQHVDTEGDSCENTWVYIGDPEGFGMVIWDGSDIWRLESHIFGPKSQASTYTINSDVAYLPIGVSIFLTLPPGFVDQDYLLFKPLSSLRDYAARIKDLRNSKKGGSVPYWKGTIVLPTQELTRAFSPSGVLVGGLSTGSELACYYVQNPLALENVGIAASDSVRLQFASSGKVVRGADSSFEEEQYWQLNNRLQKFASGTVDFDDVNFRINYVNIAELIEGFPVCQPGNHTVQTLEDKYFYRHGNISTVIR